ncbi:hypothetical protein PROFUN_15793 [Planoprotostelium fungivorum]|uniref:Uncharacterized protein n=1 Tax=Planoprotostelium fungivorum TaxID=1890364 RepID=A0A2P6MUC1_9EUKA|nr:hypothetical protein PROFUN_15793 [Planoprotostelium fungivorum]
MEAATSLFYAESHYDLCGLILDSSFSSLRKVSQEIVEKSQIIKLMVSLGLKIIRRSILNKAKFDINHLEPCQSAAKCFIPGDCSLLDFLNSSALFIHASDDNFICIEHTKGDHNSIRPETLYENVVVFLQNVLWDNEIGQTVMDPVDNTSLSCVPSFEPLLRRVEDGHSEMSAEENEAIERSLSSLSGRPLDDSVMESIIQESLRTFAEEESRRETAEEK